VVKRGYVLTSSSLTCQEVLDRLFRGPAFFRLKRKLKVERRKLKGGTHPTKLNNTHELRGDIEGVRNGNQHQVLHQHIAGDRAYRIYKPMRRET
jgi:hypothetical protein